MVLIDIVLECRGECGGCGRRKQQTNSGVTTAGWVPADSYPKAGRRGKALGAAAHAAGLHRHSGDENALPSETYVRGTACPIDVGIDVEHTADEMKS